MPQLQLPIFPAGLTPITNDIAFYRKDGKVVYFHGHLPVYSHAQDDLKSFRLVSSQLLDQGTVRQADIVSAFAVPCGRARPGFQVDPDFVSLLARQQAL